MYILSPSKLFHLAVKFENKCLTKTAGTFDPKNPEDVKRSIDQIFTAHGIYPPFMRQEEKDKWVGTISTDEEKLTFWWDFRSNKLYMIDYAGHQLADLKELDKMIDTLHERFKPQKKEEKGSLPMETEFPLVFHGYAMDPTGAATKLQISTEIRKYSRPVVEADIVVAVLGRTSGLSADYRIAVSKEIGNAPDYYIVRTSSGIGTPIDEREFDDEIKSTGLTRPMITSSAISLMNKEIKKILTEKKLTECLETDEFGTSRVADGYAFVVEDGSFKIWKV